MNFVSLLRDMVFLIILSIIVITFAYQVNVYKRSSEKKLFMTDQPNENLVKLKAEAAAPFRLLRTFAFGAMEAAGGLGTFVTLPRLIKMVSEHGDSIPELQNLAINMGGVVAATALLRVEYNNQQKQITRFARRQNEMSTRLRNDSVEARARVLSSLPVTIQTSSTNESATRTVSLGDLQKQGKQHIVIIAGSSTFVKDAVVSARLVNDRQYAENDVTVIPFIEESDYTRDSSAGRDFAPEKDPISKPAYFATPAQPKVWLNALNQEGELAAAQTQSTVSQVWEKGMVIAINRAGKVVRRGIGVPPWRETIEQFAKENKRIAT